MKYLLIENEEGQYIKINGTERYDILECEYAVGPRADDFQEYDNLKQAMEAYGVELYQEPVPEVVEPAVEEPAEVEEEQEQQEEPEQPQEQEQEEQETEEEIEEEQEQPSEEEQPEETEQEEPVEVEE